MSATITAPAPTPRAPVSTATRATRPSRRRRRSSAQGPRLTAAGIAGLTAHVAGLRARAEEQAAMLGDPRRDERLVLEVERLLSEVAAYEALLAEATVLDVTQASSSPVVVLGGRVRLSFGRRDTEVVRIVHPAEAFLDDERISALSPLARAVLGVQAGSTVEVAAPSGRIKVRVVEILEP
jgi:transcription elongation factor GreA